MVKQQMKKPLAAESLKTKKTREKIRQRWTDLEKKVTPEAIQEKIEEIHRWIARNATLRIHFENKKNIALFDENQNPATTSQRVKILAKKLNDDMQHFFSKIHTDKAGQL